jgi:hypothetical protein
MPRYCALPRQRLLEEIDAADLLDPPACRVGEAAGGPKGLAPQLVERRRDDREAETGRGLRHGERERQVVRRDARVALDEQRQRRGAGLE